MRSVLRVFVLIVVCWSLRAVAQRHTGELRLSVVDPQQAAVSASVVLVSDATQINESVTLPEDGKHTFRGLPFGTYALHIEHSGFAARQERIEIRSEVPVARSVQLSVAPVTTAVQVEDSVLLDPYQLGSAQRIDRKTIVSEPVAPPGRALLNLVMSQPGWLLEANGVLHPRGSEYDTQYVVDGFPIRDNRSPAFAPGLETDAIQSVTVMTGGFPAEYGNKMGGVVEITTTADRTPGLRLSSVLEGGSFNRGSGSLAAQYGTARTTFRATADTFLTDRYLDPPVTENFTNHASGTGVTASVERDLSDTNRIRLLFARRNTHFQVPNEFVQQLAGQRQSRDSGETLGQIAYQRVFSSSVLASVRFMSRDVTSALASNPLSTPIIADQDRGFRDTYLGTSLSVHRGHHEFKAGVELSFTGVRERFDYQITQFELGGDPLFDDNVPEALTFRGNRSGREQSAFVQDTFHSGRLTVSAGVRYDRYRLVTREQAFSPRLGVSWQVPSAKLLIHAAYDRMFSTPPMENLLLSSDPQVRARFPEAEYVPLRPSRGNSLEAGVTVHPSDELRLDVTHYRRTARDYGDDELFLNTGVSFPVAFDRATISGTEAELELRKWGRFSGVLSFTNMTGTAQLPIAGGLFLESISGEPQRFPISQDQRNTVRAKVGVQVTRRIWTAMTASYGSGLPVEIEQERPPEFYVAQYGQPVVNRVNFEQGRVRPNLSLDASAIAQLWTRDRHSVAVQFDALNITNRLNVINFAGLFSGTAVASPRSFGARLRMEF